MPSRRVIELSGVRSPVISRDFPAGSGPGNCTDAVPARELLSFRVYRNTDRR